ncbi:hypothetical protein B0H12DRAFT_1076127 [Mycena haematopus]|nr:hypothetical protein B0H12DRAFT_1076127 [Mycena haematopus]
MSSAVCIEEGRKKSSVLAKVIHARAPNENSSGVGVDGTGEQRKNKDVQTSKQIDGTEGADGVSVEAEGGAEGWAEGSRGAAEGATEGSTTSPGRSMHSGAASTTGRFLIMRRCGGFGGGFGGARSGDLRRSGDVIRAVAVKTRSRPEYFDEKTAAIGRLRALDDLSKGKACTVLEGMVKWWPVAPRGAGLSAGFGKDGAIAKMAGGDVAPPQRLLGFLHDFQLQYDICGSQNASRVSRQTKLGRLLMSEPHLTGSGQRWESDGADGQDTAPSNVAEHTLDEWKYYPTLLLNFGA